MRAPTFDRLDFLATKLLLAAVGIGVPLFTVVVPLGRWVTGGTLTWELDDVGRPALRSGLRLRDGVDVTGGATLGLRIPDAGATTWLVSLVPGLLLSAAVGLVVLQLLRLVRNIQDGRPFDATSARALRLIGATVLAATFVVGVGTGVADAVVSDRALSGDGVSMSVSTSFVPLVAGLLVLALAEAFAQGVRMQDDVEGLV